ncbi:NAD(P)H-dependent oxidoreductase [Mesorhizobium sp. VK23B]|uniref:FMN dependent NADH:quinone oxidoreductase n=1 Tax=Mesorhizobium dulcispinae TaxID=3072316 RepID=A0ABU4XCR9_9HYPH|nr:MULTISPECIES: NAD(P)H-dependent oxidoreductase [unclassified Mesorhizobium]MDX8466483.1 NAD(P)H-dependent oxidoreductase [Mesorhizobium sp. VK23B]MDX8472293.1 NAD(P)H-dependent oxidoreductase [Mesorhizobium sp. VK23A]MDX8521652.1 NAD(P)H-dependent oxidoreductase [Mesorhizobium sp. VK23D]
MIKLLYLEVSPRKAASASIEVARAFIDAYRAAHPSDEIEILDLWSLDLPPLDEDALNAKYAGIYGDGRTPAQATAWSRMEALAAPLLAADKLLMAVPLWNFSIPYRLKHYIDLVSQKDILFSFDQTGFGGLMKAKKAAVIYARGLDYAPTSNWTPGERYDFQRPYVEAWLRFIGLTDIQGVVVERTLFGLEADAEARRAAASEARAMAEDF